MSMGNFHFTKNTVEASIWCNACNKATPWKILNGRRGYCIACFDAKATSNPVEKEETQFDLFKESK
jgi:hypothetical protein